MCWSTFLWVQLCLVLVLNSAQAQGLTLTARESSIATTTGNYTELACDVGGSPEGTIVVWSVNGTAINSTTSENYEVQPPRGVLVLKKTVPELQGTYTCQLSTDPSIYDTINLSIREGCFSGVFHPFLSVGQSFTAPCASVHYRFNHAGSITWTCVDHMTWTEDVSQCSISQQESTTEQGFSVFHYAIRMPLGAQRPILPSVIVESAFEEFLTSLLPEGRELPEFNTEYVTQTGIEGYIKFVVLINAGSSHPAIQMLLFRREFDIPVASLLGSVLTAVSDHTGLLQYQAADSCQCPNILRDIQGQLLSGNNVTVSLCTSQFPLSSVCQCTDGGCECSPSSFLEDPRNPGHCVVDIDRDGVPDAVDDCDNCCLGEVEAGFSWSDALEGTEAFVSCSTLHPSFHPNSVATRSCRNHTWSHVDSASCTFGPEANVTLVVVEGEAAGEVGSGGLDVMMELSLEQEFAPYVWQAHTVPLPPSPTNSKAVIVLQFPTNVSSSVLNVYSGKNSSLFTSPPILYGYTPSASCPCVPYTSGTSGLMVETCTGAPQPPCTCTPTDRGYNCQCADPFVALDRLGSSPGNVVCALDSDGDGFADEQDDCPNMHDKSNLCKDVVDRFEEYCEQEEDEEWLVTWGPTPAGSLDIRRCPGELDQTKGLATRWCLESGEWASPTVSGCETLAVVRQFDLFSSAYASIQARIELLNGAHIPLTPVQLKTLTSSLFAFLDLSYPYQRYLLPAEVTTFISVVDMFAQLAQHTSLFDEQEFDEDLIFYLIDDLLADSDKDEWEVVNQSFRQGAPLLLRSIEILAAVFRDTIHTYPHAIYEDFGTGQSLYAYTGGAYILVFAQSIDITIDASDILSFLQDENMTSSVANLTSSARKQFVNQSKIPMVDYGQDLLQNIGETIGVSTVESVTTVMENLQRFLPKATSQGLDLSSYQVGSLLISSQIARYSEVSDAFKDFPIEIGFHLEEIFEDEEDENVFCAFWDFNAEVDSTGLGGWSTDGVQKANRSQRSASCSSTHLTTFAILLDTTGYTARIQPAERLALELVSYIGCGVSLACLLLAVLFFLCLKKQLIKTVIFYVHLNMCLALICGNIIFVAGIETAVRSVAACTIVAVLLHYFFLAAFSWMLCEGIVLYNLMVKVFGANERKWIYIYTALGWGIPVPIVAISVGARWEYYRIPQSYNTSSSLYNVTRACWLSHEYGTIAGFIAPMLAIVLINMVFVCMAIRSIMKLKKSQMERTGEGNRTRAAGLTLLKSIVILTPLLGFTWVVGLLAVNNYTTIFAWLFCFLNAFQGVFIFLFYVVRNERVWSRLTRVCRKKKDRPKSTYQTGLPHSHTSTASFRDKNRRPTATFRSLLTKDVTVDSQGISLSDEVEESITICNSAEELSVIAETPLSDQQ